MFTGLVEKVGVLNRVERRGADARLVISCDFPELVLGESIAVDGACLTVDEILRDGFAAMASGETLERTTLGAASAGQRVHLERALALGARLGGHIVSGHVDAVGRVVEKMPRGRALRVTYELPSDLAPYVAEKGSIAIDGVSLTVNGVSKDRFWVMLVPFTRGETHLDRKQPGATVNLETDVLAKYIARLLTTGVVEKERGWGEGESTETGGSDGRKSGIDLDLLMKQGYLR